jgi:hypothetical protein
MLLPSHKVCTYGDYALLQLFVDRLLPPHAEPTTLIKIMSDELRRLCKHLANPHAHAPQPTAAMVGLFLARGVPFDLLHQELYHDVAAELRANTYFTPRVRNFRLRSLDFYFRPLLRQLRKHSLPRIASLARSWQWGSD